MLHHVFSDFCLPAIPAMLSVSGEREMRNVSGQMVSGSPPVSDTDSQSVRQKCDSQCARQSPGTVRQKSDYPETVCLTSNCDTVSV